MLDNLTLPSLIVFDLDDTLWAGDVDALHGPGLSRCKRRRNTVTDRKGMTLPLFNEIPLLFKALVEANVRIAYASRTLSPSNAEEALRHHTIDEEGKISLWAIGSTCAWGDRSKKGHLTEISKRLNEDLARTVFFDNEMRNIRDVKAMGVICGYCPDGLDTTCFLKTLTEYHSRQVTLAN